MLRAGRVTRVDGTPFARDATDPGEGVLVDGEPLDPRTLTLVLHKPVDLTCSHRDPGATVYGLFPARYSSRRPTLSTVGRLDKATSGLLLLTDDGALLHRIASPGKSVEKSYIADLDRPLPADAAARLSRGDLVLRGESTPCRPARLETLDELCVRLVVTEGRYHLVRRLLAALGSHVTKLHRERIGALTLPAELEPGAWRTASAQEVQDAQQPAP